MIKKIIFFTLFWSCVSLAQEMKLGLPKGHLSSVSSSKLIQNSKLLISTSDDGSIAVWDFNSERLLYQLYHKKNTKSYNLKSEVSPNEELAVTWEWGENLINVWDIKAGKLKFNININNTNTEVSNENNKNLILDNKYVQDVKFDQKEGLLIVADSDNKVTFWNTIDGQKQNEINSKIDYIQSINVCKKNQLILVSGDSITEIWSLKNDKLIQTFSSFCKNTKPKFSNDGKYIAFESLEHTIKILQIDNSKIIYEFTPELTNNIYAEKIIEFSPNDKYVACISTEDEIIKIWNLETGKLNYILDEHLKSVNSIKFSHNEKFLVSASMDGTAIIWQLGEEIQFKVLDGHTQTVNEALFSVDDKYIITSSYDATIKVWDYFTTNNPKTFKDITKSVNSLEFFVDSSYFITGGNYLSAIIWDLYTGKINQNLEHDYPVIKTELIQSEKKLLTTTPEYLTFWNLESNTKEKKFHSKLYSNITMESSKYIKENDNEYVLTLFGDETKLLWNINTNEEKFTLLNPISNFSPNNTYYFQYDTYSRLKLFNTENDSLINTFISSSPMGYFNKSEEFIATVDFNKILIWNVLNGKLLNTLEGHESKINDIKFSKNGKYIVSASNDGSIIFWDYKTGNEIIRLFIFNQIDYLWLLPNGNYHASKGAASKLFYKHNLKTIGFEQLDVKYNRPDKVLEVLGNITDSKNEPLIKAYKKAWQKRIRKLEVDTTSFKHGFSVPKSDFTNRDDIAYQQNNGELELHIKALDSTYLLDRYNVWVNEVPIYGLNGVSIKNKKTHIFDVVTSVKLSKGINKIETSVLSNNGVESYRRPLYVNYTPKKEIKEKLYFVGIGIDKYEEKGNDLKYSVKDIRDLSVRLKEKFNNQIEIDTLFNQNVTISNIKKLKDHLQKSKVDDKVIISFSGHGLLSKDLDYYLGTYNINFEEPDKNGLPYEVLENLLDGISSRKKLLLIDACHSGEVDKDEVEAIAKVENEKQGLKGSIAVKSKKTKLGMKNSFELMKELFNNIDRATGATVVSAAAGTQFAQERATLKNGVFTYCILKQLEEKESITVNELKDAVSTKVQEITNGLQQPTSRNETIAIDWKIW